MDEKQANAELLKAATQFPEHYSITALKYEGAFISTMGYGKDVYFRVDVYWPTKLHPTIQEALCSEHFQSVEDARKAIDKAYRDNKALNECIDAVEFEKLADLGYDVEK
jgi:hypothetical protein